MNTTLRVLAGLAIMGSLGLSASQAADVTWDGSGDMDWTQPDATSWTNASYNSGDNVTFGDTGAGTVTLSGSVTPGSIVVSNDVTAYTLSGDSIDGAATLTKLGSKALTVNGNNSYSGDITIGGGTLTFSTLNSWGGTNKNVSFTGNGTLTSPNNYVGGQLSVANGVTAIIANRNMTFATVTGSGTLRYNSGGTTLNLLDASAFTGALRSFRSGSNRGGTIRFGSLGDTPGAGNILLGGGTGDSRQTGTIVLYNDAGPLTLDHRQIESQPKPNNWSVRDMIVENDNSSASNTFVINTPLLNLTDRNHNFQLGGSNTGDNEFAGSIGDSTRGTFYSTQLGLLTLLKADGGRWMLSGTNTYTGGTTISGGTLVANAHHSLGLGRVTVSSSAAQLIISDDTAMTNSAALYLPSASTSNLTMNADLEVAELYLAGVRQPNGIYTSTEAWMGGSGSLTVGGEAVFWDLNGTAPGSGGPSPSGTWDGLAKWNGAAGTNVPASWTLGLTAVFSAGSDATGDYTVSLSGTQDASGLSFEDGNVTLSGGTALRLTADAVAYVPTASQTATVSTVISEDTGGRALIKSGDGTLVIPTANTYTGPTVVGAGTLYLTHSNAIAASEGLVLSGGRLTHDQAITLSNLTITADNTDVDDTNALNFVAGGRLTMSTSLGGNWNTAGTIRSPVTGSPNLSLNMGGNTETDFNPTSGSMSLGTVTGGGLIALGGSTTGNTLAASLGSKIRISSGEWTVLGDSNAYQHFIDGGTLIVNGLLKSNNRDLKISSNATIVVMGTLGSGNANGLVFSGNTEGASGKKPGGTLTGTGVVNQTDVLNVNASARIAPGYPTGTLTITNTSCVIAGTMAIEIVGPACGSLDVNGVLDISAASSILEVTASGASAREYVIATYDSLTGTEFATNSLPRGWDIDYGATQITLTPPASGTILSVR